MTQPEALRLADKMSSYSLRSGYAWHCHKAAAELRRLHEVNQELLAALTALLPVLDKAWNFEGDVFGRLHNDAVDADVNARAAIAKAEGEAK
jgi:hypothetical protein